MLKEQNETMSSETLLNLGIYQDIKCLPHIRSYIYRRICLGMVNEVI